MPAILRRPFCRTSNLILAVVLVLVAATSTAAQVREFVRLGTYNIKFLNTQVVDQGDRLAKLRTVIESLDADVLGLQEIDDRAALHILFPASQHDILIDDQSSSNQDVALVVRRPCTIVGQVSVPGFVFPGAAHDSAFPGRRDLLKAKVACPAALPFTIFVHHAKSRLEGRTTTEPRRIEASRKILAFLRNPEEFNEQLWAIVGDFNDNPDDASANILETGDPNAVGREENDPDPFAVNLTEALLRDDHVSHGHTSSSIAGSKVDTRKPGSRTKNNDARGTNENTGPILFDQILVSQAFSQHHVANSIQIFDGVSGVQGNRQTRASDHLPVAADFSFAGPIPLAGDTVVISRLLPDPAGRDVDNERVVLKNKGQAAVTLQGWTLEDADGHSVRLDGLSVNANAELVILRLGSPLSLNNNGDTVRLKDATGAMRSERTYTAAQVRPGIEIVFE
jgi:endonuclease/exonuclease/phosphatase family metal-dependent hydrolase